MSIMNPDFEIQLPGAAFGWKSGWIAGMIQYENFLEHAVLFIHRFFLN